MKISEILKENTHRPWKIPNDRWKFYQEWNEAVFLHWQVEMEDLMEFVPKDLEIDLFEGKPWISLVAFNMERIRPRYLPSLSPISNFGEINIRTYVKFKGKTGVYFLSMEGGKKLSCFVAKTLSELPYRYSKMNRDVGTFKSSNTVYNDHFEVEFGIKEKLSQKTEIDKWLTERYGLFQDAKNFINEFEIHHIEWPVNNIEIKSKTISYPRFASLLSKEPDLCRYSSGVQVIAWGKKKHLMVKG